LRRKTQRIDDAKKKIQIDVVFWVLKSLWVVVKKEVPKPEIVAAAVVVAGGGGGGIVAVFFLFSGWYCW
jgi:hypothetical protein